MASYVSKKPTLPKLFKAKPASQASAKNGRTLRYVQKFHVT